MLSKIERNAWAPCFDLLSKAIQTNTVEVQVNSLEIGSQIEAEWLPLLGMTYDSKSDIVEIVMEGLDHMISHPKEIHVEQDEAGVSSFEVIDEDDVRQVIRLHDPIPAGALPGTQTLH